MTETKEPRMMWRMVFPETLCEDCGKHVVWRHREDQPFSEAWLECPNCGKIWPREELNYSPADQDAALGNLEGAIAELSARAIERVEQKQPQSLIGRLAAFLNI